MVLCMGPCVDRLTPPPRSPALRQVIARPQRSMSSRGTRERARFLARISSRDSSWRRWTSQSRSSDRVEAQRVPRLLPTCSIANSAFSPPSCSILRRRAHPLAKCCAAICPNSRRRERAIPSGANSTPQTRGMTGRATRLAMAPLPPSRRRRAWTVRGSAFLTTLILTSHSRGIRDA